MNKIEKRFNSIQETEPDTDDLEAINRINENNDTSEGISLEQMDLLRVS